MSNSTFSFKSILITGLKIGIAYSAVFAFLTTGWFVVIISAISNESTFNILAQKSASAYYGFILAGIFVDIILTVLTFIFIGFPVIIIPATLSSGLLSYWLYKDFNKNKLFLSKSRLKGMLLGSLSGVIPGLLFFNRNAIKTNPLTLFTQYDFIDFVWGVGLFVLPFIFGGIAGFLLGTRLTRELNKNGGSIEPKEDYFKIDWKELQKEQQENDNLTPDTSTHDI